MTLFFEDMEALSGGNYLLVPHALLCGNCALKKKKKSLNLNMLKLLPVSSPAPLYSVPVIPASLGSQSCYEETIPGVPEGKEGPSVDHGSISVWKKVSDGQTDENWALESNEVSVSYVVSRF